MSNRNKGHEHRGMFLQHMKPNRRCKKNEHQYFMDEIQNIAKNVRNVGETISEVQNDADRVRMMQVIRSSARNVTVSLRTILLDSPPLILRAVERPGFHRVLPVVKHSQPFGLQEKNDEGRWVRAGTWYELGNLPGFRLGRSGLNSRECQTEIFDLENRRAMMNLHRWLNQPVMIVRMNGEEETFRLGEIMRYAANTDAAHFDRPSLGRQTRRMEMCMTLGDYDEFFYPQWLALCVGNYLHRRVADSLCLRPAQTQFWEHMIEETFSKKVHKIELTVGSMKIRDPRQKESWSEVDQKPWADQALALMSYGEETSVSIQAPADLLVETTDNQRREGK